jgi:DNA primase
VLFGIDLAKREIARRHQVVVVEGYTDVMAMHASGVPTAVASCGTAFGGDHISVLRRLLMDDDAFRGEVIFTFDGDAAGQKAALRAFEDEQRFASQTYVCIAPDGMDPCELKQSKGATAVRDLVARRQPLFTFAIKAQLAEHDLDTAEGRVEALRRAVPLVAQIKDISLRDEYARQLAGWIGWEDTNTVVRRVREIAGGGAQPERKSRRAPAADPNQGALAVDVAGPARPRPNDPALWTQREALKVALQVPALAGPYYDALPEDVFAHPAYLALHRAVIAAGGASGGVSGPAFVDAVAQHCPHQTVRSLLTELAVEPLQVKDEVDNRYVESIVARLQETMVAKQVADLKSRLQRLSPVNNVEEYHELFGDLVALEQYRKALRDQSLGGLV